MLYKSSNCVCHTDTSKIKTLTPISRDAINTHDINNLSNRAFALDLDKKYHEIKIVHIWSSKRSRNFKVYFTHGKNKTREHSIYVNDNLVRGPHILLESDYNPPERTN